MGIALKEKQTKREIKNIIKSVVENNIGDEIKDVLITGEERVNPKLPSINIMFYDSKVVEGRGLRTLFKVEVGIACLLKDVNLERGKIKAEDFVGIAADLIIDNLPKELPQDVLKVEIEQSGEEAEIEIRNDTILASAVMLSIYYFI